MQEDVSNPQKNSWDKRVKVYFQEKAWCDEKLMKEGTHDEWSNIFTNLLRNEYATKIQRYW